MIAAMKPIRAIFENGVFRPIDRVDLPDRCEVRLEAQPITNGQPPEEAVRKVYAALSLRCRSGEGDVAARHDEHQP
jgi:predicted DNA-binding antitoxin AbrB/MazE fold protein